MGENSWEKEEEAFDPLVPVVWRGAGPVPFVPCGDSNIFVPSTSWRKSRLVSPGIRFPLGGNWGLNSLNLGESWSCTCWTVGGFPCALPR